MRFRTTPLWTAHRSLPLPLIVVSIPMAVGLLGIQECSSDEDGDGWTVDAGDCDDTNAEIHPGAQEICDNIDQDCDEDLLPCSASISFDDAADAERFEFEAASGCTDLGVADGALNVSCADNNDAVYWLDFDVSGATEIHIYLQLYTENWNDGGPRIGVDFGSGFTAWGPTEGYAFHISDPYDATQGSICSYGDTCPSITKNGNEILDYVDVGTREDDTYSLGVELLPDSEYYELTFDDITYELGAEDLSTRDGRIGMHCSEGDCSFMQLNVAVQ